MAAGFHHNLTNPATKWFELRSVKEELMDDAEVANYFSDVTKRVLDAINQSNFDNTMQEFYKDVGCFGTGTVLTLEDPITKIRFRIIPPEQLNLEEDSDGRVSTVYRNFRLTALQAWEQWGLAAGKKTSELHEKQPNEFLKFLHCTKKRSVREEGRGDAKNLPWMSLWIAIEDEHLIGESGFNENPYAVGRFWKDENEVFGFSPAMDVLADIKLINTQQRTLLRSAMKVADPPLDAPAKGYTLPFNLNPSAMNYRNPKLTKDQLIRTLPVNQGNIPVTVEVMKMVKESIEEGFNVPLFKALSQVTKQMTVPEVQRRIFENMVLLGPVVGRFTNEVLSPIITRVFNILQRDRELPDPPAQLQGEEFEPFYLSPLAKAQRESDMIPIESFLGAVGQIESVVPGAIDWINPDRTVSTIRKIKGVPPEIMNSPAEVEEIRAARIAAQEQAQQLAAAQGAADTIQKGAKANKDLADAERVAA